MDNKQETYNTLLDYLDRFIVGMERVAGDYRGGKEGVALKGFTEGIDGLIWITTAVNACQDMFSEPISLDGINPILMELTEALSVKDYVLMCDLIEYEVIPIIEGWKEKI